MYQKKSSEEVSVVRVLHRWTVYSTGGRNSRVEAYQLLHLFTVVHGSVIVQLIITAGCLLKQFRPSNLFKSTKTVPQLGIKLATYAFQAQFPQRYATPMPLEKILLVKLIWAQVFWHVWVTWKLSFVTVVMVMAGTSRRGCGLPPFPHLCCLLLPGPPKLPSVLHCSFF